MSSSFGLSNEIVAYLTRMNRDEHPVLARCREETHRDYPNDAQCQISPEQAEFMTFLARTIHARRAIEVGVFTGYSSLAVALALQEMHGDDAHLLACDVSEEWTARARRYWDQAGVAHVIDLELGGASETLDRKIEQGLAGTYDFAFIDADKTGYGAYYERCLTLLRSGGVMLFDNMLRNGRVADDQVQDLNTVHIRQVAEAAKKDGRIHAALTNVGDGLLLCLKR